MKDEEHSNSYHGNRLCDDCVHNFLNNDEGTCGCRAFPDGIPDVARYGHAHHTLISGQVGDYIYRKAKYEELSPFAKLLRDRQVNR